MVTTTIIALIIGAAVMQQLVATLSFKYVNKANTRRVGLLDYVRTLDDSAYFSNFLVLPSDGLHAHT